VNGDGFREHVFSAQSAGYSSPATGLPRVPIMLRRLSQVPVTGAVSPAVLPVHHENHILSVNFS
jgi:hypothetical protein